MASLDAASADAKHEDAVAATSADDAAASADAIAATLTAAKTGDLAALTATQDETLRAVDAYGSNALHWAAGRGGFAGNEASIPRSSTRCLTKARLPRPAAQCSAFEP